MGENPEIRWDWLMYRVASDQFEAACGLLNLSEALKSYDLVRFAFLGCAPAFSFR